MEPGHLTSHTHWGTNQTSYQWIYQEPNIKEQTFNNLAFRKPFWAFLYINSTPLDSIVFWSFLPPLLYKQELQYSSQQVAPFLLSLFLSSSMLPYMNMISTGSLPVFLNDICANSFCCWWHQGYFQVFKPHICNAKFLFYKDYSNALWTFYWLWKFKMFQLGIFQLHTLKAKVLKMHLWFIYLGREPFWNQNIKSVFIQKNYLTYSSLRAFIYFLYIFFLLATFCMAL